jgi:hypothetical protein
MTSSRHPPHIQTLLSNGREVDRLQAIHSQITTPGPGRKYEVEIIHKSSIVLLVACWEAFVEDLASVALDFMIAKAKDHSIFSKDVLNRIASNHQGEKVWELAGQGWKTALRDNQKLVLAKTVGALNTPKAHQIDELFLKTIGLSDLSGCWYWPGGTVERNTKYLDKLVTLRGSIAHRVKATTSVRKKDVLLYKEFIGRIAIRSHNRVGDFLETATGVRPWNQYTYKGRK